MGYGVFLKMEVPQNDCFIMENLMNMDDDYGGTPMT